MRHGSRTAVALILGASIASACRTSEIPINLRFTNEAIFAHSDRARVLVYEDADTDTCSRLVNQIESGNVGSPVFDTGSAPICDFFCRDVVFPSLPGDRLAFIGFTYDDGTAAALADGCTIADPHQSDGSGVVVRLQANAIYDQEYLGRSPPCLDAESCCAGTCGAD